MDNLNYDAVGNLPGISAFLRWPESGNSCEAAERTVESRTKGAFDEGVIDKERGNTVRVLFKGKYYIHDIREVRVILKQEMSDALQENNFEARTGNYLPHNNDNKETNPALASLASCLCGSSEIRGNMLASIHSSSRSKPDRSEQASAPIQASQASSQLGPARSVGTKQFFQAAMPAKPGQVTSSGKSTEQNDLGSVRLYPVLSSQAIGSSRSRAPDTVCGPVRGYFTPGKFGPLSPPIDPQNRPPVDFSVGLRRHDLPPRQEVNWFAKELPVIDRSDYLRFYATQMFSDVFLKEFLRVEWKAYGEVDPYLCPETKMPMYPRTVWLLEVSKQLHLPHTIGAHGLMIQQEVPVPTTKTMPLFIGEKGSDNCWWYAGEFQVDGGELFAPVTKKHRKSMQGWAERFAEWAMEKEKEGEWNHITVVQWKNAMYDRMLSKVRDPNCCNSTQNVVSFSVLSSLTLFPSYFLPF